jgi:hypothetical protein
MRPYGGLTCRHRKPAPSRTAVETIAAIQRMLERGCTPEELAQAEANRLVLGFPRQPQLALPLKVRS